MSSDFVEDPSVQTPLSVFRSVEEAERDTERWLTYLAEKGRHGWERVGPLQLRTQPTPNLPCRLLGMTGESPRGGHLPLFMLMAGKRRRRRYWQSITRDVVTGEIHSPEVARQGGGQRSGWVPETVASGAAITTAAMNSVWRAGDWHRAP